MCGLSGRDPQGTTQTSSKFSMLMVSDTTYFNEFNFKVENAYLQVRNCRWVKAASKHCNFLDLISRILHFIINFNLDN